MQVAQRKSNARKQHETVVLEEAFASFTHASAALEESYRSLEERIAGLTEELAEANDEQVRQAEENARLCGRLVQLVEALPAGVLVIDGGGAIAQSNAAARALLGESLEGVTWSAACARAVAHVEGNDVALCDGRRLTLCRRELPDRSGHIVLLTDDSEARAARELLDRHRRLSAMGEMAARLAHQIRTPLSAALLYVSQLATACLSPADRQRFAERAVARLQDLDRTIQEMLAFARGGSSASDHVRLGSVLAEVVQILEPEIAPALTLQVVCEVDDVEVLGSRIALAGAIVNLVSNAAQAMDGVGTILLEARAATDDEVIVRVSDDGPGVAPEHRARIFEPFFTTRRSGTGLGLAIVKSVVEAHQGSIALEPSALGGASFAIRLPARLRGRATRGG